MGLTATVAWALLYIWGGERPETLKIADFYGVNAEMNCKDVAQYEQARWDKVVAKGLVTVVCQPNTKP